MRRPGLGAPDSSLPVSARLCLAPLRVSGAELLQLEGCLMLPSCRRGGEGGERGRVSHQTPGAGGVSMFI